MTRRMWKPSDVDQIEVDLVRELGTHDANGNRYTLYEYREYHMASQTPQQFQSARSCVLKDE